MTRFSYFVFNKKLVRQACVMMNAMQTYNVNSSRNLEYPMKLKSMKYSWLMACQSWIRYLSLRKLRHGNHQRITIQNVLLFSLIPNGSIAYMLPTWGKSKVLWRHNNVEVKKAVLCLGQTQILF